MAIKNSNAHLINLARKNGKNELADRIETLAVSVPVKPATATKNIMDLAQGDVIHAHGARFAVTSTDIVIETDKQLIANGNTEYMRANGVWLDGKKESGYFGPGKDFMFQGNKNVTVCVELSK